MAGAARLFEGEHDFTAFSASSGSEEDDRDRSGVRVVYSSELRRTAIFDVCMRRGAKVAALEQEAAAS